MNVHASHLPTALLTALLCTTGCGAGEDHNTLGAASFTPGGPVGTGNFGTGGMQGNAGAQGGMQGTGGVQGGTGGVQQGGTGGVQQGGTGGVQGGTGGVQGGTGGVQGGSGGMAGGAGGMAGGGFATATGTLTVAFTTVDQRGRYAPRNIGAVWVETAGGQFVKTLERWAGTREQYLYTWKAASGGWGLPFFGTPVPDQTDVVSRATLSGHSAHTLTWNLKDADGQDVIAGNYKLMIEVTDSNSQGDVASADFTLGPSAQVVSPPDSSPYTGLTITP